MTRQHEPAGRAQPPGDYDTWDAYMADVEAAAPQWDRHESTLIGKAMRLAPNTAVFCALLEGQDVPVDALDQVWRRRYGL